MQGLSSSGLADFCIETRVGRARRGRIGVREGSTPFVSIPSGAGSSRRTHLKVRPEGDAVVKFSPLSETIVKLAKPVVLGRQIHRRVAKINGIELGRARGLWFPLAGGTRGGRGGRPRCPRVLSLRHTSPPSLEHPPPSEASSSRPPALHTLAKVPC